MSVLDLNFFFRSISRKDLVDYVSLFYKPARMVLAGAGGVSHDELVKLGEKHFGNVPPANMDHPLARQTELVPCRYTGSFENFVIMLLRLLQERPRVINQ